MKYGSKQVSNAIRRLNRVKADAALRAIESHLVAQPPGSPEQAEALLLRTIARRARQDGADVGAAIKAMPGVKIPASVGKAL